MSRLFLALCLSLGLLLAAPADAKFSLRSGQRVVFLGDSITFAGMYIQQVDAYLATRFPDQRFELLNLGLPSETVSGLSEPDHPYPRPSVHERLERVLASTKPDLVVACYGMNDGIYYPFSEERFAAYQAGVRKLVERCRQAGARVVLMTPPPFDVQPVKAQALPLGAPKYSWMRPYAGYNDILERYASWLRSARPAGGPVIDTRAAIDRHLAALRPGDPQYRLAGDGVHMDATGHWLIAQELLRAWEAPAEVDAAVVDAKAKKARKGRISGLSVQPDEVRFQWTTRLPMPHDPQWDRRTAEVEQIAARFNRHTLAVTGLPHARYTVYEGETPLGEASREELAAGLDLTGYPDLSTNRRSAELLKLIQQRRNLLDLAWLTHAGHKRPDTPKGLPLAEAQAQAASLDAQIRQLAQPTALSFRLAARRP